MKQVNVSELVTAVPIPAVRPAPMTRREKLMHWAQLIRKAPTYLHLMHNLEYLPPEHLQMDAHFSPATAFGLANQDPKFAAEGLKGNTLAGHMKFFELSQAELHEFSCDCGGMIDNEDMAHRIEKLAGPAPQAPIVANSSTWTGR